jgi:flavin reductase (DIM6/NTAB) family NADH-FMN oxidoreductase RutF
MEKKTDWKPGTLIYPLPAVLVSCGATPEEFNMMTVSWTGTICSNPPMCYVSIRPERHSYDIVKRNMAFVINLTTLGLAFATDWCGVKSGRNFDKFKEMNLTPVMSDIVTAPYIAESPVSIECRVTEIKSLGSHDMFIAEVVGIKASERLIDPKTQAMDLKRTVPIAYLHGKYYTVGEFIGKFGFSVEKPKKKKPTGSR